MPRLRHGWTARTLKSFAMDCAIRERQCFLDAITPEFGKPDEETAKLIEETLYEIRMFRRWERQLGRGGDDERS